MVARNAAAPTPGDLDYDNQSPPGLPLLWRAVYALWQRQTRRTPQINHIPGSVGQYQRLCSRLHRQCPVCYKELNKGGNVLYCSETSVYCSETSVYCSEPCSYRTGSGTPLIQRAVTCMGKEDASDRCVYLTEYALRHCV